jgi:subtilisin family serine protease
MIDRFYTLTGALLLLAINSESFATHPEVSELIVRFKELPRHEMTVQELVQAVENRQALPDTLKMLSYPVRARPLLHYSVASDKKHTKTERKGSSGQRAKTAREKLDEYVVLEYKNSQALDAAKKSLENDPNVIWVGENEYFRPHAAPADPLFPVVPQVMGYQWGLHAMRMPQAWDYAEGHAYVAIVDSGIEVGHADLQQNFRQVFSYDFAHLDGNVDEKAPNYEDPIGEPLVDQVPFRTSPDLVGHGTHVAGIIAATANNGLGGAGVCMHCSLMVAKSSTIRNVEGVIYPNYSFSHGVTALTWLIDTGVQVVNMSFGRDVSPCPDPESAVCVALDHAKEMDVVVVAATGNDSHQNIDFPAIHPHVIAVGAVDKQGNMPTWSSRGPGIDLVAPGVDVVSTFYTGIDYIPQSGNDQNSLRRCRDSLSARPGFGPCSGTSMASPHVAGGAALLRSVNPLLSSDQIRDLLKRHGNNSTLPNNKFGHGMPNMLASVRSALGSAAGQTLVNRLTPLFSLYSSSAEDHLHTASPQMAMAAMYQTLQPQPDSGRARWMPSGAPTPGYSSFPIPAFVGVETPRASAYIFTTHRNPFNPEKNLVPLYRLSYQGSHAGNARNLDHAYTTEQSGINAFVNAGYRLNGIEGYIFPDYEPQPPGTVKLYRKYNAARDDHAIFPETQLAYMTSIGYTQNAGKEWIGYVYANQDSDNDGLIDGFERVIGTSINRRDTDRDGISDGVEVNNYPYSDPLDNLSSPVFAHRTPRNQTTSWRQVQFSAHFADSPVLLSQMQSYFGADTAATRVRNLTNNGVALRLEEESSRDAETGHTTESVGIFGIPAGAIHDINGRVIGEAGFVMSGTRNNRDWRRLEFSRSYNRPVVLMEMTSYNGGDPAHMRLRNVASSSARYQIEEWDYLDQAHTTETIGYVVLEQGRHRLPDGKIIQVGEARINHLWSQVNIPALGGVPVLLSQSQTYAGSQAVVTRQRNINATGFQVKLQEEEGNNDGHAMETVGYLAVY